MVIVCLQLNLGVRWRHVIVTLGSPAASRRMACWAPLLSLAMGCARYEWVNELDVPGVRAGAASRPAPISLRFETPRDAASDAELHGRVVSASGGDGLGYAQIRFTRGAQVTEVVTDSAGWFTRDSLPAGHYELWTRRIGFAARRDSLPWPLPQRESVLIPLTMQVLDGPCSGFAAVRVPKP